MYDHKPTFLSKSSVNSPINFKKSPQKYALFESPINQQKHPQKTASSQRWMQWNPPTDYLNIKKISDEYSNLRQTFDYRTNTRLQQRISKYDFNDEQKTKDGKKINNMLRKTFNSKVLSPQKIMQGQPSTNERVYGKQDLIVSSLRTEEPKMINSSRNSQNIDKIKKYTDVVEKFKQQNQNTNKKIVYQNNMSYELKKLRENRIKRLQKEINHEKQLIQAESFKKKNNYQYYTPRNDKVSYNQRFQLNKQSTSFNQNNQRLIYSEKQDKGYQTPTSIKYSKSSNIQKILEQVQVVRHVPKRHNQLDCKIKLSDFVLGKNLGQGKFGTVYQAFHKLNGCIFAIKKVPKDKIKNHFMIDQFILQLKLQTFLNHQYILSIYGCFQDKTSIFLILEYMEEGTLFTHLKKNKTLPQTQVAIKIKQIASAVKYLHQNNIAHRDIKPQNIVMSHGVCKLCDYGWATICEDRRKTYCGTPDYVPPQILQGAQYDYTVDLWCLGILTYQLLVGKAPFYHISRKQTAKRIMNVQNTQIQYPENMSKIAISFIDNLVKKNPKDRMSSDIILKHPFLKNAQEKK